ncbi:MAG: hypothetical protein RJA70_1809 [Pseudomonadota bacterium]
MADDSRSATTAESMERIEYNIRDRGQHYRDYGRQDPSEDTQPRLSVAQPLYGQWGAPLA